MEIYSCPLCGSRGVDTDPQPSMNGREPRTIRCENRYCLLGSPTVRIIPELWNGYPDLVKQHRAMRECLLDIVEDNPKYMLDRYEILQEAKDTLLGVVKI